MEDATERTKSRYLEILNDIRKRLKDAGAKLDLEVPIEEGSLDVMGMCDVEVGPMSKKIVHRIIIRFEDRANECLIDLASVIATFIHELAHSITPLHFENGVPIDHSPLFYNNFASLLKLAERSKIFILPSTTDKFSMKNLQRMDNIDREAMPFPSSSIPLYYREFQPATAKIRLTVQSKGLKKPIELTDINLKQLLKVGGSKFALKAKSAKMIDGTIITDDNIGKLAQDTILILT
eukprot:TRINITY_DN6305_c0_g1_i2.p1 TRINITY_DN6305_c0_g1~~TRINITY_DN6305_c0_g1_i2.p1  ORF type:complete len:236 (-),score=56.42 TRINITY_DN6305_c0_g1_i2:71-778(-)